MQIVTIANTKGGTGKTTLSVHLCYYLQRYEKAGKKTVLIDADLQSNSSDWLVSSTLKIKAIAKVKNDVELYNFIKELEQAKDVEYCIIDCPAGLPETARTAIMLCSILIIPTQPHLLDLQSSNLVINYLEQVRRVRDGKPPAYIFLNRCHTRSLLMREAEFFLENNAKEKDLIYIPYPIHNRLAIADAPNQRTFVFELEDEKAFEEFYRLCNYLTSELKGENKCQENVNH